jgi:hypothetical protein
VLPAHVQIAPAPFVTLAFPPISGRSAIPQGTGIVKLTTFEFKGFYVGTARTLVVDFLIMYKRAMTVG